MSTIWKQKIRALFAELAGLLVTVLIALTIGFIIIYLSSDEPWTAFKILLTSPVQNSYNFGNLLERMVPYVFTGLAVAVAFKALMFNIGAEGQLYAGALLATMVGLNFAGLPPFLHVSFALLAGVIAGGLFAAIPGYLKAYWEANEIVTTLMLNFVATLGVSYLVNNPLNDAASGYAQTKPVLESARLYRFFPPSRLHIGFFIALAMAVLIYYFLFKTRKGYEIRMVGLNPDFAEYGGINRRSTMLYAMIVSGALAGLAGAVEILGIHWRLIEAFSPGYGFDGINVSLLARNHPLGVPIAAFFYAWLNAGAAVMERSTDVSREVVKIIQAILFFFITAEAMFRYFRKKAQREVQR